MSYVVKTEMGYVEGNEYCETLAEAERFERHDAYAIAGDRMARGHDGVRVVRVKVRGRVKGLHAHVALQTLILSVPENERQIGMLAAYTDILDWLEA